MFHHVKDTNGLLDEKAEGTDRNEESVQSANKKLSTERKEKVDKSTAPDNGIMSWSVYEKDERSKD